MLLLTLPMMSQSKPFFCTDNVSRFVECDLHAVTGLSVFSQDYATHVPTLADIESSPGYAVGLGAMVQFAFKDYFAIGTQLDFIAHNNKYSMVLLDAMGSGSQNSVFVSNRGYSASVPVFASVRFNVADNVRWNVDLGCYFGLGLGGYQKADTYTTTINELNQIVTTYQHYKWDYYNEKQPLIHGFDDFDFGLLFRTGLLFYDHYKVDVEARINTKNATTDEGVIHPNVRNHMFAMKLGYQF